MFYDNMLAVYHTLLPDYFHQTVDKRDQYDADIRQIVDTFNRYLATKYPGSNYHNLDWRLVKAMIWVESGHQSFAWKYRPMQIGNIGDAGLKAVLHLKKTRLKNGKIRIQSEGAELIIPPKYKANLTLNNKEKIRHSPKLNIQAGVAYLLMRHARFGYTTVMDKDPTEYKITVQLGDNIHKIAAKYGSTVNVIKKLNPQLNNRLLPVGYQLRYKKAAVKKTIIGWYPMNYASIAEKYNAHGDRRYKYKLKYTYMKINHI